MLKMPASVRSPLFGLSGLSGFLLNETIQMNPINQMHQTNHTRNNGETWIRPTLHLAASRQLPDHPSGVESSHPEYSGRLQVSPAGRAFTTTESATR